MLTGLPRLWSLWDPTNDVSTQTLNEIYFLKDEWHGNARENDSLQPDILQSGKVLLIVSQVDC